MRDETRHDLIDLQFSSNMHNTTILLVVMMSERVGYQYLTSKRISTRIRDKLTNVRRHETRKSANSQRNFRTYRYKLNPGYRYPVASTSTGTVPVATCRATADKDSTRRDHVPPCTPSRAAMYASTCRLRSLPFATISWSCSPSLLSCIATSAASSLAPTTSSSALAALSIISS